MKAEHFAAAGSLMSWPRACRCQQSRLTAQRANTSVGLFALSLRVLSTMLAWQRQASNALRNAVGNGRLQMRFKSSAC
jgi:hypothetical protein